jgi:cerevisin
MKYALSFSLLPLLAAASPMLVDSIHNEAAPILSSSTAKEIPNSYIVIFKKDVTASSAASHHGWVQDLHLSKEDARTELRKRSQIPLAADIFSGLKHTYDIAGGLLGYSGHFDDEVIEEVRRHPDVSFPRCIIALPAYHRPAQHAANCPNSCAHRFV